MYNFPDIAPVFSFAVGAFFGIIGLLIAFIAGIWIDLPSWGYLASSGVPALIAGAWYQIAVMR